MDSPFQKLRRRTVACILLQNQSQKKNCFDTAMEKMFIPIAKTSDAELVWYVTHTHTQYMIV